jgi:uncharacterized protein with PIN domain
MMKESYHQNHGSCTSTQTTDFKQGDKHLDVCASCTSCLLKVSNKAGNLPPDYVLQQIVVGCANCA